ncbi:MAG TPA: hypothetical protein ENI82_02935 [Bacteroidetes bacterium]|nr:hypothetical protein [Bacteroidota bacterium]
MSNSRYYLVNKKRYCQMTIPLKYLFQRMNLEFIPEYFCQQIISSNCT